MPPPLPRPPFAGIEREPRSAGGHPGGVGCKGTSVGGGSHEPHQRRSGEGFKGGQEAVTATPVLRHVDNFVSGMEMLSPAGGSSRVSAGTLSRASWRGRENADHTMSSARRMHLQRYQGIILQRSLRLFFGFLGAKPTKRYPFIVDHANPLPRIRAARRRADGVRVCRNT